MNLYQQYLQDSADLDKAKNKLDETKSALYTHHIEQMNAIDYGSTFSTEDQGFKVKIVKKESTTIDHKAASLVESGFTAKYSVSKTAYNKLSDADKKKVDACITTKPAKPTFTVEAIDA